MSGTACIFLFLNKIAGRKKWVVKISEDHLHTTHLEAF